MSARTGFWGSESEAQLDAAAFDGDDVLWFAARAATKPAQLFDEAAAGGGGGGAPPVDCWTLVSTPDFAVREIERLPMRDPVTGAFRPQEPALLDAIARKLVAALARHVVDGALPAVRYATAQRWGSGLPAPPGTASGAAPTVATVVGDRFDSAIPPLVPSAAAGEGEEEEDDDYIADDEAGLYLAGDFVSSRPPGVEAAVLSGFGVAAHIARTLGTEKNPSHA